MATCRDATAGSLGSGPLVHSGVYEALCPLPVNQVTLGLCLRVLPSKSRVSSPFLSVAKGLQSVTQRRSRVPRLLGVIRHLARQPPSAVNVAFRPCGDCVRRALRRALGTLFRYTFTLLTFICLSTYCLRLSYELRLLPLQ